MDEINKWKFIDHQQALSKQKQSIKRRFDSGDDWSIAYKSQEILNKKVPITEAQRLLVQRATAAKPQQKASDSAEYFMQLETLNRQLAEGIIG